MIAFIVSQCLWWFFFYSIIQSRREDADPFENYTVAIQNIENVGNQLSNLVDFLKQERERVEESRATLRLLQSEKSELEPVVVAQRDAVNAILSAYTRTTASKVWRERALGFASGLVASLVASLVFEYLRR